MKLAGVLSKHVSDHSPNSYFLKDEQLYFGESDGNLFMVDLAQINFSEPQKILPNLQDVRSNLVEGDPEEQIEGDIVRHFSYESFSTELSVAIYFEDDWGSLTGLGLRLLSLQPGSVKEALVDILALKHLETKDATRLTETTIRVQHFVRDTVLWGFFYGDLQKPNYSLFCHRWSCHDEEPLQLCYYDSSQDSLDDTTYVDHRVGLSSTKPQPDLVFLQSRGRHFILAMFGAHITSAIRVHMFHHRKFVTVGLRRVTNQKDTLDSSGRLFVRRINQKTELWGERVTVDRNTESLRTKIFRVAVVF